MEGLSTNCGSVLSGTKLVSSSCVLGPSDFGYASWEFFLTVYGTVTTTRQPAQTKTTHNQLSVQELHSLIGKQQPNGEIRRVPVEVSSEDSVRGVTLVFAPQCNHEAQHGVREIRI